MSARYAPVVDEILALDRASWEAFKPRIRAIDAELSRAATRAEELHYGIRFNAFMGVRSDYYLAEETGIEWATAAARPVHRRRVRVRAPAHRHAVIVRRRARRADEAAPAGVVRSFHEGAVDSAARRWSVPGEGRGRCLQCTSKDIRGDTLVRRSPSRQRNTTWTDLPRRDGS